MPNQSDSENSRQFPKINKVTSAESYLMDHGGIKSSHEENTVKVLPPRMRQVMQQNTAKVQRRVKSQLRKFVAFVEDMQNKSQSKMQLFPGSSHSEAPKPTESFSTKPDLFADPRTKNAPLRDAFQIVRNLLWRISNLINQVAADIPAEDDPCRDVQSPHFDYHYAQYVFQLIHYILQIVGKELEQFCLVLAEFSADDALYKYPTNIDEVDENVSSHKTYTEENRNSEVMQSNSGTSYEVISSASDGVLSNEEIKKQAQETFELLTVLSKKIICSFQNKGLPEFNEMEQREMSKIAMGMPELCENCSQKVVKKLRRYTSRENLFAEKYEKSSNETLFSSDSNQRKKSRHAFFSASTQRSHQTDSKPNDIKTSTISHINLGSTSTPVSDAEIEIIYKKQTDPLKSPSHREPLIGRQTKSVSVSKQIKGSEDMIVKKTITVTEDPEIHKEIEPTMKSDKIQFNLQEFCTLLKNNFSKLLSEESKSDSNENETSDSNLISNLLIKCFREASKGGEVNISHSSVRFDVTTHSSPKAVGENKVSDSKPSNKEAPSAEEYEKQLDEAVEKFVVDTYQLALSALEKKKKY